MIQLQKKYANIFENEYTTRFKNLEKLKTEVFSQNPIKKNMSLTSFVN